MPPLLAPAAQSVVGFLKRVGSGTACAAAASAVPGPVPGKAAGVRAAEVAGARAWVCFVGQAAQLQLHAVSRGTCRADSAASVRWQAAPVGSNPASGAACHRRSLLPWLTLLSSRGQAAARARAMRRPLPPADLLRFAPAALTPCLCPLCRPPPPAGLLPPPLLRLPSGAVCLRQHARRRRGAVCRGAGGAAAQAVSLSGVQEFLAAPCNWRVSKHVTPAPTCAPALRRRGARPPFASQAPEQRVVALARGRPARLARPGPNPGNDNSAAVVAFQAGGGARAAEHCCRAQRLAGGTAGCATALPPWRGGARVQGRCTAPAGLPDSARLPACLPPLPSDRSRRPAPQRAGGAGDAGGPGF